MHETITRLVPTEDTAIMNSSFLCILSPSDSSDAVIGGQQAGSREDYVGQFEVAPRQSSTLLRPVEHPL